MATWASSDGLHWRVASRWTASVYLEAIGTGTHGVVGLGSTWSGPLLTGRTVALGSATGATWSHSGVLPAFGPRSSPISIVARGSGYLAVGGYQPRARSGGGAWTSPDGLAWTRVLYVPASTGSTSFEAVAPIGPGYAIVGLVAPPSQEPPYVPTVWLSPDRTHWRTGVALPSAEPGDWLVAAAGNGRRLVVTGWASATGVADPFVWIATYRA